jgi:hypothetical protein
MIVMRRTLLKNSLTSTSSYLIQSLHTLFDTCRHWIFPMSSHSAYSLKLHIHHHLLNVLWCTTSLIWQKKNDIASHFLCAWILFQNCPQTTGLRELTLGIYQIKLTKSYTKEHLKDGGEYEVLVNKPRLLVLSGFRFLFNITRTNDR